MSSIPKICCAILLFRFCIVYFYDATKPNWSKASPFNWDGCIEVTRLVKVRNYTLGTFESFISSRRGRKFVLGILLGAIKFLLLRGC